MRSVTMCFLYFFMFSWASSAIPHHPTIHEPLSSGTEPMDPWSEQPDSIFLSSESAIWKVNACASFFFREKLRLGAPEMFLGK